MVEYRLWNGQRDEFYRGEGAQLLTMRHFPAGAEGQSYWYHLDGRGSVAGITKHQGQSTHNYRYDAYGQLLPAKGNWTDPHNHYTFSSKEWDEHLDSYEFGYRLYDPAAGLWLTRDPLRGEPQRPRTLHRYAYAFASPISYRDPYGLQGEGPGITPVPTPPPQTTPTPTPLGASTPTGANQCAGNYLDPQIEMMVREYASTYGVPWQVLGGLLKSEVELDTDLKDLFENVWYTGMPLSRETPGLVGSVARLYLAMGLKVRPSPGPGIGNVHVQTAWKVSEYFATNYADNPEMQLMLSEDVSTAAFQLVGRETNVRAVAAYTRMLADYRFGSGGEPLQEEHADLSEWTMEDAAAIWHGYRYGVEKASPPAEKYGFSVGHFQNRNLDLEGLIGVAEGIGAEESMRGSTPYFECYFGRCD